MKKLDKTAQLQILEYFEKRIAPAADPRHFGKPLKSTFSGLWRYRIGNYRAICHIEDENLVTLVVRAAHRSKVYSK